MAAVPADVPPILLEGDAAPISPVSGPGERYALGPTAPSARAPSVAPGELPVAYGTGRLSLMARDPHWLFACWDFTDKQLHDYNRESWDGHLVLRAYEGEVAGRPVVEQAVHPESRSWFLHIPRAGARYSAELGLYDRKGKWKQVSISAATLTPRDQVSGERWVRFETLPFDLPLHRLVAAVKEATAANLPLLEAVQQLRTEGHPQLPLPEAIQTGVGWTPEQERALAAVLTMDEVRRVWIGSLEITELVRRQLAREVSSAGLAVREEAVSSISSPFGGLRPAKGFWFNVNAELIVYGATEPAAEVQIGGRTIKLRADGSFSYRFALPDGQYSLPITARSADGTDTRAADLAFSRQTAYRGEVGSHPQDAVLKAPAPANVS